MNTTMAILLNFIFRYSYIFWLKNPAAFHDEFWCVFINVFANVFGLVSQLTWHQSLPRQPIGYYICSGIDPTEQLKIPLKIYGVQEISCLLLNVSIWIRIKIFKCKERHFGARKTLFLKDTESLINFGIIIANMLLTLVFIGNQVGIILVDCKSCHLFLYHKLNLFVNATFLHYT